MLQNQTTFYVPGFEESTSDIDRKLTSGKNRQRSKLTVELLSCPVNLEDQLLCS